MYIEVDDISLTFDTGKESFHVLDHVSLSVDRGEFICIIGPSGCGKSTLLNVVAGFLKPDSGSVNVNDRVVKGPDIRRVMIFQNYGLLPWRNVQKQVELGLESLKMEKSKRRETAGRYIDMVGLGSYKNSLPGQLSGGQQQRVSIARALAVDPEVIYMDEPFGALDAITRMKLQDDVRNLCKEQEKTVLFVTHDIEEAVYLADRIVVMEPGPGHIKGIINVTMPGTRDRTSSEFITARDRVFEIFHLKSDRGIEYYI